MFSHADCTVGFEVYLELLRGRWCWSLCSMLNCVWRSKCLAVLKGNTAELGEIWPDSCCESSLRCSPHTLAVLALQHINQPSWQLFKFGSGREVIPRILETPGGPEIPWCCFPEMRNSYLFLLFLYNLEPIRVKTGSCSWCLVWIWGDTLLMLTAAAWICSLFSVLFLGALFSLCSPSSSSFLSSSAVPFLPPEDDVVNHGNFFQSSGCVHTLPLVSPAWIFRVTRSEVRGHAVITGCRPTATRYRSSGTRSNSCSLNPRLSRENFTHIHMFQFNQSAAATGQLQCVCGLWGGWRKKSSVGSFL